MASVLGALNEAVEAATHLGVSDAPAVEAARALARKIDSAVESDNVSIPTFLKYCDALGFTPVGRSKLGEPEVKEPDGKLAKLRSIPKPKAG